MDQFLIVVAFTLTINKAQGQSLKHALVYFPQPVFGHGQLYFALSQATSVHGLIIGIVAPDQNEVKTLNMVKLQVICCSQLSTAQRKCEFLPTLIFIFSCLKSTTMSHTCNPNNCNHPMIRLDHQGAVFFYALPVSSPLL